MKVRLVACAVAALPVLGLACVGQPERTFFGESSDGSSEATFEIDASASDANAITSPDGDDGPTPEPSGDDAGESDADAAQAPDGDAGPVENDAAGDANCGPLDTIDRCGSCLGACDTVHSAPLACATDAGGASTCTYSTCSTGYADCVTTPPNTNGCETPITTPANCGGCGIACDTAHSTSAGCGAAGCTYGGCAQGFKDCNPTAPDTDGCETPVTTVSNCTGCGIACNATNAVSTGCGATGCTYTCATGYSSCGPAPNAAGCTCATPGCCGVTPTAPGGTSCQTEHVNALGNYYDCNAVDTYSYTTAHEACAAYTGDSSPANCQTFGCAHEPTTWAVVCSNEVGGNPNACVCWEYSGGQVGRYDTSCLCPATFDPTWQ